MKTQLLTSLYDTFDKCSDAPINTFESECNEPSENPDWALLFRKRWDNIDVNTVRVNWDAFIYMTDDAVWYYFPLIIKTSIIDPTQVDWLQDFLLRSLSQSNESLYQLVAKKINIRQRDFLLTVVEDSNYVQFCIKFDLVEERNSCISNLSNLFK
jgi:hypothetical protein